MQKGDGTPYKVFTPFYRRGCLAAPPPREPLPRPALDLAQDIVAGPASSVDDLRLLPDEGRAAMLAPHWQVGEIGAMTRLQDFIADGLAGYKDGRNLPAKPHVSRLSPHFHWGELSVNQAWYAVRAAIDVPEDDVDNFCAELGLSLIHI